MLQTCNHWIIPKLIISPITYKTATAIYFLTIFLSFTQHNNPTVSNSILNMASVSIFSIPLPCLGQCLLSAPSASPLTPHSFYSFPRSQVIFFYSIYSILPLSCFIHSSIFLWHMYKIQVSYLFPTKSKVLSSSLLFL